MPLLMDLANLVHREFTYLDQLEKFSSNGL